MLTILMTTYNGEAYVEQQLDSIMNQTFQDFHLVVRDDCSTDGTFQLLEQYAISYPQKMTVLSSEKNSGSAKYNFLYLMLRYTDNYVMLSDQDDVWNPDKIEVTLGAMREAEAQYGSSCPLLVHTDLQVVDRDLRILTNSYKKAGFYNVENHSLEALTVMPNTTGCTTLYNRSLAKKLRMPNYCQMHDYWLSLSAAAMGKVIYLSIATLQYRQHGNNQIGAKLGTHLARDLKGVFQSNKRRTYLFETCRQAESMLRAYPDLLSDAQKRFLEDYAALPSYSKWKRWKEFNRLKVIKSKWWRKAAQLLYMVIKVI